MASEQAWRSVGPLLSRWRGLRSAWQEASCTAPQQAAFAAQSQALHNQTQQPASETGTAGGANSSSSSGGSGSFATPSHGSNGLTQSSEWTWAGGDGERQDRCSSSNGGHTAHCRPRLPQLLWQQNPWLCSTASQQHCHNQQQQWAGLSTSASHSREQQQQPAAAAAPTWLERSLPAAALPYAHLMRLEKPIGTYLLAWPGLWSIALAAEPGHLPDPWLSSLFIVGAVLLRGAGCTVNDLWDRDIDKQVERTRRRPLASGAVTVPQAVAFLALQLSLGLCILLQLNTYTQALGVASLGLVATYPLMKRVTGWPQAFLGLTMNWGALMGWSAVRGDCDWTVVLPLYAAGINWSLVYDTIYAHQDKKDDQKVGIGSTALTLGPRTKPALSGFAAVQTACLLAAGAAAGAGGAFQAAVAAGAAHQAWQIWSTDLDNGPDCMAKFVSNKWYGAIIYAGIVADRLLSVGAAV